MPKRKNTNVITLFTEQRLWFIRFLFTLKVAINIVIKNFSNQKLRTNQHVFFYFLGLYWKLLFYYLFLLLPFCSCILLLSLSSVWCYTPYIRFSVRIFIYLPFKKCVLNFLLMKYSQRIFFCFNYWIMPLIFYLYFSYILLYLNLR